MSEFTSLNGYAVKDKVTRDKISLLENVNVINIGKLVDELTSANIVSAINEGLTLGKTLYIPSGNYVFNIEITDDCTLILDDECYISTNNYNPCIYANGCSFSMHGGNVVAGSNNNDRLPVWGDYTNATKTAIISLNECYDGEICNVKSPYSKHGGVFQLINCKNYYIKHLDLNNMLLAGVRLVDNCKTIIVDSCSFKDINRMTGHDYCYAVCCGLKETSLSYVAYPVDDIVMTNNLVEDSEDCALDCHGGTNIRIANNKVLETVNAITAYNDNNRVGRPEGWKMNNVIIENNYCKSSRDNEAERDYPHSYIIVGAGNVDNGYDNFNNCVIRNNYFESPNSIVGGVGGIIYTSYGSRNLSIENNVINCLNANNPTRFYNDINFTFKNNRVLNAKSSTSIQRSQGCIENNSGFRYTISSTNPSFIEGPSAGLFVGIPQFIKGAENYVLDVREGESTVTHLYTSVHYGIRVKPNSALTAEMLTFTITVADGVATCPNNVYPVGTSLRLNNTTTAYVWDTIDPTHFIITNASGAKIADGEYTAVVREASLIQLD